MNKTLVAMTKISNELLLRFEDGEIMKFVANIESDYDCTHPTLTKEKPDAEDLHIIGAISDEELAAIRAEDYCKRQETLRLEAIAKQADQLLAAWKWYYQYGEAGGFTKPVKYPPAVKVAFEAGSYNVLYKGIVFTRG